MTNKYQEVSLSANNTQLSQVSALDLEKNKSYPRDLLQKQCYELKQILDKENVNYEIFNNSKIFWFLIIVFVLFFALIFLVGIQQLKISNMQKDFQNKFELIKNQAKILTEVSNSLINKRAQKDDNQETEKLKNQIEKMKADNIKLKTDLESQIRKRVQKKQLYQSLADLRNDLAVHRQKNETIITPKGTVSEVDLSHRFNGFKIEQYLYPLADRQKRREYFNFKKQLYNNNKVYNGTETPFSYVDLSQYDQEPKKNQDIREYEKLNSIYNLNEVKEELPMCLVVGSYNNQDYFRVELNLNSIFQQNYTNYMAIIFNDKSTDRSNEIYLRYFQFYNINKDRYIYFNSHIKKAHIQNVYNAGIAYCSENSIMVHLDGDDELLGKNVLKVLNSVYQKKKAGFVYSLQCFRYNIAKKWFRLDQWAGVYSDQQKKNNMYRDFGMRYFHLRSYRSSLLRKIKIEHMMEDEEHFFEISSDAVLFVPIMELSCGKVIALDYINYIYNVGTGYGEGDTQVQRQRQIHNKVRKMPKYVCDPSFEAFINGNQ